MPFDSFVVAAVSLELRRTLLDGTVGKIYQPTPLEVLFHLRVGGANHRLLASAHPHSFRLGPVREVPPNPETPPQFCRVLRKHLEGARLRAVEQEALNRVVRLGFSRSDGERWLHVELMGKHSNLVLTDAEGTILDAIKHVTRRVNRYREVLPGRPYLPPPAPEKPDPLALSPNRLTELLQGVGDRVTERALTSTFAGLGSFAAGETLARAVSEEPESVARALASLLDRARAGAFAPTLLRRDSGEPADYWAFESAKHPASMQEPADSLSAAVEAVERTRAGVSAEDSSRSEALARAQGALERSRRRLAALQEGLSAAGRAEEHRVKGELLLAYQGQVPRGARSVELPNFHDAEQRPLAITLDPALTARENAERYFQRHRKARAGLPALQAQTSELEERIRRLEALAQRLEGASGDGLREARAELEALAPAAAPPAPERREEGAKPAPRVRRMVSSDGWEILVGETAEGNDHLTTRLAAPDDLWLHVRGAASAHVVIRTAKRPEAVPRSTLLEAARAAATRSEAKHSSLVAVDYTLRKYVRKPRGSGPGKVLYEREKTLHVDPSAARTE